VLLHEDITTRMRAEEKIAKNQAHIEQLYERLQHAMVETHHRVKNNLQIIAAMIDLRLMDDVGHIPVGELARLGRHVRTLAAVHELLTKQAKEDGEAHCVSAKEVLEHLLPLLSQMSGRHTLRSTLEEVSISSRQATALSLVINELVSNAVKHGREDILVKLSQREGRAVIAVEDDGPGFPPGFDADRAANTGMELVNRLSRWDLHGDIRYANLPGGGAIVCVEFPLPAAPVTAST
jgi:two-component sensor histidine kinase